MAQRYNYFAPDVNPGKTGNLDQLKQEIITDADNTISQRDKSNEDMRFINVAGGQWEGFLEDQLNDTRVKLELDLVSNPLWRFVGEWTTQRIGVEFKPNDSKTTENDSDLLNGIYRANYRENSGKMATDNAVLEAATCGVAAFKLATMFENDEDETNENMSIEWRPIYNAYNSIFWDVSAQRIDKRDANRCVELSQFTREGFETAFPGKDPSSAYTPPQRGFEHSSLAVQKYFHVATRYDVVKEKEVMFVYNDLINGQKESYTEDDHDLVKDELTKNKFKEFVRERKISRRTIHKTVFSGEDILKKQRRVPGKWIPIVPVYGYRVYVDGQEWYWGLVRKKKDSQRVYNMQVSQVAETAGTGGQEIPIFDPKQMEGDGVMDAWSDRNNKSFLFAHALRNDDGTIAHMGPIGYAKTPSMEAHAAALLELMPKYITEATGEIPQEVYSSDMSGKAISQLTKRANLNTQTVNDNISSAIAHSGRVFQGMAAEIYTSRRIVRTVNRDDKDGETLLQRMTLDEETGRLVMANDLRGKRFQTFADVGPQYATLNEQATEEIKGTIELIKDVPGGEQYIPILMALLFKNFNASGVEELKKFNRKIMLQLQIAEPESDDERKFLADLQAGPKEPDPQEKFLEAEAERALAEGRSLDASSVQKTADAQKKAAETEKIQSEVGTARAKIINDRFAAIQSSAAKGL